MIVIMAWRNIWRNKMRSIVIILSIAIGLFAGIAVLALYKGMMKSRVRTVIDAEVGHLQIHDTSFKKDSEPQFVISNGADLLNNISSMPEVKLAAPHIGRAWLWRMAASCWCSVRQSARSAKTPGSTP